MIDEESQHVAKCIVTYTFIYFLLTILYCLPRILCEYGNVDISRWNENFTFNLDIFALELLVLCTSFSAIDSGTKRKTLIRLFKVEKYIDNSLLVTIVLFIIFVESLTFNLLLGHTYDLYHDDYVQHFSGIDIPTDEITVTLALVSGLYADASVFKSWISDRFKLFSNRLGDK